MDDEWFEASSGSALLTVPIGDSEATFVVVENFRPDVQSIDFSLDTSDGEYVGELHSPLSIAKAFDHYVATGQVEAGMASVCGVGIVIVESLRLQNAIHALSGLLESGDYRHVLVRVEDDDEYDDDDDSFEWSPPPEHSFEDRGFQAKVVGMGTGNAVAELDLVEPDGTRWLGSLATVKQVTRRLADTDDSYFGAPGLFVVPDLEKETIGAVVRHLIDGEEFRRSLKRAERRSSGET